ncbi:serine hydrolase domain-containing protein [Brachybacterium hainanense]|uniref:Serine hydrolase domain-containing protein n=1 Tax=Brachybacterium hainanense TaxID=1541174 RepID=A0ABV6RH53_9MICO
MPTTLHELLSRHVREGTVPGVIASSGRELDPFAIGRETPQGRPLRPDAIVRIQSMTKLVATVAALRLVEEGGIGLDEPVARFLPELAAMQVLPRPDAPLSAAAPARTSITLRHLLTCTSGIGVMTAESPLSRAMEEAGVAAGPDPVSQGATEWLAAVAALPLAFEPGTAWRYHHSFGLLGILLGRVGGQPTIDVLRRTVLDPAGMVDTGFSVPPDQAHRLLPALRRTPDGFEVAEPGPGGFHVAPAPYDLSHAELVSTLADYHRFLRALVDGELLGAEHLAALRSDQVPTRIKGEDSFFPGFWDGTGWGFGVCVLTQGPHTGRFGWSGGLGTDFFVDPDGSITIVLAQVEMDEPVFTMIGELQDAVDA